MMMKHTAGQWQSTLEHVLTLGPQCGTGGMTFLPVVRLFNKALTFEISHVFSLNIPSWQHYSSNLRNSNLILKLISQFHSCWQTMKSMTCSRNILIPLCYDLDPYKIHVSVDFLKNHVCWSYSRTKSKHLWRFAVALCPRRPLSLSWPYNRINLLNPAPSCYHYHPSVAAHPHAQGLELAETWKHSQNVTEVILERWYKDLLKRDLNIDMTFTIVHQLKLV